MPRVDKKKKDDATVNINSALQDYALTSAEYVIFEEATSILGDPRIRIEVSAIPASEHGMIFSDWDCRASSRV